MAIFDTPSLQRAIQETLSDALIPSDYRHAFVVVGTIDGGVKGVYSTKINDIWQVDTFFAIPRHSPIEGGIAIKAVWKDD